MILLRRFGFLPFCFACSLASGCAAVTDPAADESSEFGEQIGETQQAVTQADRDAWRNKLQIYRNWDILMRAYQDNNRYVGLNCKEWARKVVFDASKGVVYLPSTYPDAYGWQWYPSPYTVKLSNIYAAAFGNLVQMNLATGPHTAIVASNDGTNICWIESNWKSDNTVRTRCQTISQFLNSVTFGGVQKYSVYLITGG